MEKIKIIELLQRLANGNAPKLINKGGFNFIYNEDINDYRLMKGSMIGVERLFKDCNVIDILNDEVEIIEEDKKIEKIEKIDMFDYFTGYDFDGTSKDLLKHLERNFEKTNEKFNEIIDYINKENK